MQPKKYEIQIGQVYDLELNRMRPKQTIEINQDQFDIIRRFATVEISPDLNRLYILNNTRFYIVPKLVTNLASKVLTSDYNSIYSFHLKKCLID